MILTSRGSLPLSLTFTRNGVYEVKKIKEKAKRIDKDFYPTPFGVIDLFLKHYHIDPNAKLLEPCAGNGNIIRSLQKNGYSNIKAVEIREDEFETLYNLVGYGNFAIGDFLTMKIENNIGLSDVVITNPPFSLAMEFLNKSLEITTEKGIVIMLLRLGFMATDKRYQFMSKNPPTDLYVLHKRPSFTGGGTDSQEYAWYVWDKRKTTQSINII